MRCHYYKCHSTSIKETETNEDAVNLSTSDCERECDESDCDFEFVEKKHISCEDLLKNISKHFTLFLLKLREKHILPGIVQETVFNDVKFLLQYFAENYQEIIKFHLEKSGFRFEDSADLQQLLNDKNIFERALSNVGSEYQLLKYCEDSLGLIKPSEVYLGASDRNKQQTFQYVPILRVLKLLLDNEDIVNSLCKTSSKESCTDVLENYTDGTIFKNNEFFSGRKDYLRIHLYTDEFEIVNPLGSKKTLQKLCAFYFSLENIETKYQSQLHHIHLCILVKHRYLQSKDYSYSDILQPLIRDLKRLQNEGIIVSRSGCNTTFFGGLATISADNLSAHSLGGFTCSFSNGRVCRYCMAHHRDIHSITSESSEDCIVRTTDLHCYHLRAIQQNPGLAGSTYGVLEKCCLEELDYF